MPDRTLQGKNMCGELITLKAADFEEIIARLDATNEKLAFLALSCKMPETIDIGDIAKLKGISRTQITGKERYLLPNFGLSQYPEGPIRWDYAVYEKWNRRPVAERKDEFEAVLDAEKKQRVKEKNRAR